MDDGNPTPVLGWSLDPSVVDRVRAWAIEVDGVEVRDEGRAHESLEALARARGTAATSVAIGEVEGIDAARRLYRAFGVDPTRHRPSSEALMRRARKGQSIYRLNEVVDVGNWVSLEWLLPLGLYDRDRIVGDVAVVRVGRAGEEYEGILTGYDQHMNLVLDDVVASGTPSGTEPRGDSSEKPDDESPDDTRDTTIIRGDNVVTITT